MNIADVPASRLRSANYNIPPHFWIWCFIRSTQPADLFSDNTPQLRIYITGMFFVGLSLPENGRQMIEQLHNISKMNYYL